MLKVLKRQICKLSPTGFERRRSPRYIVDMDVGIRKHRKTDRQELTARDLSTGGMRIEPPVQGYVGEHVYVHTPIGLDGIEARIANQEPAGTGIRFVFAISDELVRETAGDAEEQPYK